LPAPARGTIFAWAPDNRQPGKAGAPSPLTANLNLQPLDHPVMHQVFLEDFVDIFPVNVGVPDTFGVNDDDRPFVTAIKTSRCVDSYTPLARKAQRLAALLGVITHGLRFKALAAGTAICALVDAEKNVITVIVHRLKDTG